MALSFRSYGPLSVHPLAFGAGHIGDPAFDDAAIGALVNLAVDRGMNLFDTALSYGLSEDRIRRHLGHRRNEILLSTKVGYGVPGHPDWTPGCIAAGIDQALGNLGVDHLDIVHLHSCPTEVLANGGVIEPLLAAVEAGKVRVAAYSGDNDALDWAVDSKRFGGIQASYNLVDTANGDALRRAAEQGIGVLVKRSLANAVWRFDGEPGAPDQQAYWTRWRALGLADLGIAPEELALRFVVGNSAAAACLVGTSKPANLLRALDVAALGPLPDDVVTVIEERRQRVGAGWPAVI